MIQINNDNFHQYESMLQNYIAQSLNELNRYFDADELFEKLNAVRNYNVNWETDETICFIKVCMSRYMSFDGFINGLSADTINELIVNICTKYLEDKL